MTLTAADVAEIVRLIEQSSFDELTLEVDGLKLTLRRGANGIFESREAGARAQKESAAIPPGAQLPPNRASSSSSSSDPDIQEVPAPLLGTFYRAPKPGAPPFIEVGATVEPNTIIGIIEVMKLMNTVRAGVSGTVTEILATDGALVEYGETLLRVRKGS